MKIYSQAAYALILSYISKKANVKSKKSEKNERKKK